VKSLILRRGMGVGEFPFLSSQAAVSSFASRLGILATSAYKDGGPFHSDIL
jgi:hypothetical protein